MATIGKNGQPGQEGLSVSKDFRLWALSEVEKFRPKTIAQIKWENRVRRWKRITASLSQLLNLFPRIDAPSSVLVVIGLSLSASLFV